MSRKAKPTVVFNSDAFNTVVQQLQPILKEKAEAVAARIDSETSVHMTTNRKGRPAAILIVADPAAVSRQAKYGYITQAAAAEGFDISRYPLV